MEIKNLNAAQAISFYNKVGLKDEIDLILENNQNQDLEKIRWPWNKPLKAWEHTSYAYGFINEEGKGTDIKLSISDARSIKSDDTLKNKRITVSLDFLRIFDYPGKGKHQVLFKFNARNEFDEQSEDVSFNQTFSIQEGQRAPFSGYPIFIGLGVGTELVQFSVQIINVSNDDDEKFLNTINSGIFSNGLKMLGAINPVIPIVTEYAKGVTEMIAKRNRNIEITSPTLGLYFGNNSTRIKLTKGAYIAVQTSDPQDFDWSKWVYNKNFGTVQSIDGTVKELPFNYFIFSISQAENTANNASMPTAS
jgi:hypothetical protein